MNAVALMISPVVRWAALRTMVGRNRLRDRPDQGRFTRTDVRRIHGEAWRLFGELGSGLPLEPTRGGRMNVSLACVTLAYLQALLAAGVERAYAIELIADAAWKIYEQWGRVPRVLARFVTRDPVGRMRWRVGSFLRFPFNPPAYDFERLPTPDGLTVTMHRCPVADYLRAHSAADLCVGSWCNMDYALAEMWGGQLERRGTLAGGEPQCDFRFKVGRAQSDTPHTDSPGPGATDARSEATVDKATALTAPAVQR